MLRLDDLRPAIDALFRHRLEEVVACEMVTELAAKKTSSKPRLLILCRPPPGGVPSSRVAASTTAASRAGTLNLLTVEGTNQKQQLNIRQTFPMDRFVRVSHDGSFDAGLNFGASGVLNVSFESHIQREMFVASIVRLQHACSSKSPAASREPVVAVMLNNTGADDSSSYSTIRKLRQQHRRVCSTEEEQRLLREMDAGSFDDLRHLHATLLERQRKEELSSMDLLIRSSKDWEETQKGIRSLIAEVEVVEARIDAYSTHLLSKRGVIQSIEHQSNMLQRKQQNLEQLHEVMENLKHLLSIPEETVKLIAKLPDSSRPEQDCVRFFSEGKNAVRLSEAMRHMHAVLRNPTIQQDYPIRAVADRRLYFEKQQLYIAQKAVSYVLSVISTYERKYLDDRSRLSREGSLVWVMHDELFMKLTEVGDIVKAMAHIDAALHTKVLTQYRTSMRRVYVTEAPRFLKYLRKYSSIVGSWKEPFLMGVSESQKSALTDRVEAASVSQASQQESPYVSTRAGASSWNAGSDMGTDAQSTGGKNGTSLTISFPSSQRFPDVEVFSNPSVLRDQMMIMSVHRSSAGVLSALQGGPKESIRPHLAFAMAIQSVLVAMLTEEHILSSCFDVCDGREAGEMTGATAPPGGGPQAGPSTVGAELGSMGELDDAERARRAMEQLQQTRLFHESMSELFGGSTVAFPPLPRAVGRTTVGENAALRQVLQEHFMTQEMCSFTSFLADKCDRMYFFPILCMLRGYQRGVSVVCKSSFCLSVVNELEGLASQTIMRFAAEQTESIAQCAKKFHVKPTPLLHCFSRMPSFFLKMESMHDALSPLMCDRTAYCSVALSIVNQSFEALNQITYAKQQGEMDALGESSARKAGMAEEGSGGGDKEAKKRGCIQQYRHHSYFCSFCGSLAPNSYAAGLLRDHFETSKVKVERYGEMYVTQVLLIPEFPKFGEFVVAAENLPPGCSDGELSYHRIFSPDAVRQVVDGLEKELRSGIRSTAERMKRHLLRDVSSKCKDESFHELLYQRTWQRFARLILSKFRLLTRLLESPSHKQIQLSLKVADVERLLTAN